MLNIVRTVCAVLLALPFLVFGLNHFLKFFKMPAGRGTSGERLLEDMRTGGLMDVLAASHVAIGVLLIVPQTSFAAALLQLPITIGIMSFHLTMLPEGNMMGAILLLLNLGALAAPERLRSLIG